MEGKWCWPRAGLGYGGHYKPPAPTHATRHRKLLTKKQEDRACPWLLTVLRPWVGSLPVYKGTGGASLWLWLLLVAPHHHCQSGQQAVGVKQASMVFGVTEGQCPGDLRLPASGIMAKTSRLPGQLGRVSHPRNSFVSLKDRRPRAHSLHLGPTWPPEETLLLNLQHFHGDPLTGDPAR